MYLSTEEALVRAVWSASVQYAAKVTTAAKDVSSMIEAAFGLGRREHAAVKDAVIRALWRISPETRASAGPPVYVAGRVKLHCGLDIVWWEKEGHAWWCLAEEAPDVILRSIRSTEYPFYPFEIQL